MESNNSNSSPLVRLIPVVIIFVGLVGLYYLYQYMFGPKINNSFPLITSSQSAKVNKAFEFSTTQLAPLYEGGEFSISTWINISDWAYRSGYNKPIIQIGGSNFDTIQIYLGANKPTLQIRFDTKEINGVLDGAAAAASSMNTTIAKGTPEYSNHRANDNMRFQTLQTGAGLLDELHPTDIPDVPMQRWVNIVVAVNGKTVDVYMDGKLSRSTILPNPFKVDSAGYTGYVLKYGGFGGQISTTNMYDYALNPENVYRNYMAGPEPINSLGDLFSSLFVPNLSVSISTS